MSDIDVNYTPHKYDKFVHSNGMPYAYLEVPTAFLSEELPTNATWSSVNIYSDDEQLISSTQRTIEEYCLAITKSLDETKAIICLMATVNPTYRARKFTYDDLQDWETWLNTKSYTIDNFLTISERNTLLDTSEYSTEE